MTLSQQLSEYVRAGFAGIWIQSHEHDEALVDITRLCRDQDWRLAVWDIERGLSVGGAAGSQPIEGTDPLTALRSLPALAVSDDEGGAALLVLVNLHRFLSSAEMVQALSRQIITGKQAGTFVVVLAPIVQIPTELEKLFVVIEHDLPDRDQLAEIARGLATEGSDLPDGPELETVLEAAGGLTRYEAEGAFSLSLVRHRVLRPDVIWDLKGQMLKKEGLLTLYRGQERFADLGGLEALKQFCLRAMRRQAHPDPLKRPRGVLLLSPPGCGKSALAKALGNETGRPTAMLDVGSLMGSLVGQTEERTRKALKTADAMAPCVLMVDEIEKALSGVASSGQTDSGVSARMFGSLLTWLNDHTSDVFLVATCNNIKRLPPEFSRAERFDGVFFVDLPGAPERQTIWNIYLGLFGLDADQPRPNDEGWTGAEIRSCCRLAALLDVPLVEAAQNVVPVSATAAESVDELRRWASGRCLSADRPGLYEFTQAGGRRRRRVQVDPSTN